MRDRGDAYGTCVADTITGDKKSITIETQKMEKQKQTDTSFECTMLLERYWV